MSWFLSCCCTAVQQQLLFNADISATTRWISDLSGSNESYGGVRYESEGIFTFYRLEEKL